jgi:hypothetical protein
MAWNRRLGGVDSYVNTAGIPAKAVQKTPKNRDFFDSLADIANRPMTN